jgi:chemotaxis protein methyltransferase CheR
MTRTSRLDTTLTQRLREFAFGDEDFAALRKLVRELTGISLTEQKRELVYGRLSRRLRALKLDSFGEYRQLLAANGAELVHLCNAITTNLTAFFREQHHFVHLRDHILRPLASAPGGTRRLRIWSAGCSTGEEPYSIAMSVLEALPDLSGWDIRILATDLDSDVLERARRGIYPAERVTGLDTTRLARFFSAHGESATPSYEVVPELRALISFRQLNLVHRLPMKGPLDIIFCRNTIIYFDKETQRDLFGRMAQLQRPGDLLFVGHSENLFKVSTDYTLVGRTIYRRN